MKNCDLTNQIRNTYKRNKQLEALHHVEAVAEIAVGLAKTYNLDLEKIKLAALLHDISAIMTPQEMYTLAKERGLEIDPAEEKYHALLHQRISAIIAQEDFEITDSDILNAVECHTTLKKNASVFDKIIFIADKISRDPNDVPQYDDLQQNGNAAMLDSACYFFIKHQFNNGLLVFAHQWLLDAYEELRNS
ncbi:MAG: bis(5'-nucleosyl)-tetraphosphatase (symmetrical) YqeK [Clostridia bacterium]|nr:bis(5'-nucleosyl)-tetraphosphatase (symmetrical) YqeK [Clostridia bacterium]